MLDARTAIQKTLRRAQGLPEPRPVTQQEVAPYLPPDPADYLRYKRKVMPRYDHPKHNDVVDYYLMQVLLYVETQGQQGIGHLILNEPPRHGKTLNLARLFPGYVIGRHPEWTMILTSYGASLALESSRAVRNLIASDAYREEFPGVHLSGDSFAANSWMLAGYGGGMKAMGVGGGVTGKGGHILIGDDLISGRKDAESEVVRDSTYKWWTDDLYTRGDVDYAAFILSGTRWHEDDPIGRAIKNEGEVKDGGKWVVVNLPAIFEAKDRHGKPAPNPLNRQEGEALWEKRWGIKRLRVIEKTQGPYSFSALYQGNPTPAEGGLFKRSYFGEPILATSVPALAGVLRAWDLAMSDKTMSDFTVGMKYGMAADLHRYVLDVARDQIEWGNLTDFMANVMLGDGPNVPQYIEYKGFMSRAVQALVLDPRLQGYSIFGIDVDGNKVTRALPAVAKAAAKAVHLVKGHWVDAWLDEICSFPQGAKDDQVDAFSLGENVMATMVTEADGGIWYDTQGIIPGSF